MISKYTIATMTTVGMAEAQRLREYEFAEDALLREKGSAGNPSNVAAKAAEIAEKRLSTLNIRATRRGPILGISARVQAWFAEDTARYWRSQVRPKV